MKLLSRLLVGSLLVLAMRSSFNAVAQEPTAPRYAEHVDLTYYLRADGSRAEIRTPKDWRERRQHILTGIQEAMGPLPRPANAIPLDVEILEEHSADGLVRRKPA